MKINEKLINKNFSSRNGTKIKYIVIHDTGNTGKKADADAHYSYFNNQDRQASAHYFVDDRQVLRVVKDEDKSWHCGDGNGKNGITNANSIGIEMCINVDGDFSVTYKNTLALTQFLMKKYNINLSNVIRHYDASGKLCPNTFKANNWEKWNKFKKDLSNMEQRDYKEVINKLYLKIFDREADANGLKFWNDKINEGLTFGDFLKEMGESPEFKEIYKI